MELSAIVHRLDVTRARVEAEVAAPGIIAVTSAVRGDGKSLIAAGLAYGLAAVGHSVLLVEGNPLAPDAASAGSAPRLDQRPEYDILSYAAAASKGEPARLGLASPGVVASCSVETVRSTFGRFRDRFAYTVIDSAVLVESGMALVLASEADGVVIAFKQGRGALEADREFVKVLQSAHTPVLGVVTTHPKAIREFAAQATSYVRGSGVRMRASEDGTKNAASLGVRV